MFPDSEFLSGSVNIIDTSLQLQSPWEAQPFFEDIDNVDLVNIILKSCKIMKIKALCILMFRSFIILDPLVVFFSSGSDSVGRP